MPTQYVALCPQEGATHFPRIFLDIIYLCAGYLNSIVLVSVGLALLAQLPHYTRIEHF